MSNASMSFDQFIAYMIGDYSAAAEVIEQIMRNSNPTRALDALNKLDDLNIRGILIWYCFSDVCQHNVRLLLSRIENDSIAEALEEIPYAQYKAPV